ncbi:MAG: type II secretion system F family protein [Candidatus Micrarchaeota archaeon]|nr:type II secretion system F family protein [Candidatus Micrarchaeota archaeon]
MPTASIKLLSDARKEELAKDLRCAGLGYSADAYATYAFVASLVAAVLVVALLLSGIITDVALQAVTAALVAFLIFLLSLRIPKVFAQSRARRIEADLPIQLRALSTELAIGVPFESALESAASFGDSTQPIFQGILSDLRNGISPADAINRARQTADSRMLDKALSHLAFLYSYGYEGSGLNKLVDEISSEHKARLKEFASRSSVMGVILIALTSVIPALATTYILVGSSFMDLSLTAESIYIIYILLLPLLTLSLLLAIRFLSPPISKRGADFLSKDELTKFTVFLGRYGIQMPAQQFLPYLGVGSLALSIILFAFTASPFSFLVLLLPLLAYGVFLYLDDMRISSIEEYMPDALFYAASLHTLGMEKAIQEISKANYGELSKEFKRASRQISAGFSVRIALQSVIDRNKSPVVERGISLLIKIHEVGASLEKALKSTAEDIHDLFMLLRERESILSMQKYNLMLACILVPAIFGAVLSLVASLDLRYIETLLGTPSSRGLLPAVEFAVNIYLLEFSVLASLFIADYSGSWKRFAVYLVFILPSVFGVFYVVRSVL